MPSTERRKPLSPITKVKLPMQKMGPPDAVKPRARFSIIADTKKKNNPAIQNQQSVTNHPPTKRVVPQTPFSPRTTSRTTDPPAPPKNNESPKTANMLLNAVTASRQPLTVQHTPADTTSIPPNLGFSTSYQPQFISSPASHFSQSGLQFNSNPTAHPDLSWWNHQPNYGQASRQTNVYAGSNTNQGSQIGIKRNSGLQLYDRPQTSYQLPLDQPQRQNYISDTAFRSGQRTFAWLWQRPAWLLIALGIFLGWHYFPANETTSANYSALEQTYLDRVADPQAAASFIEQIEAEQFLQTNEPREHPWHTLEVLGILFPNEESIPVQLNLTERWNIVTQPTEF